jgi:RimJ/RimL family protein N-acetyltransferase
MEIRLVTEIEGCFVRSWQIADKDELVRIANKRQIWRNLTDLFPHPYTEADADFWIAHANTPSASIHQAVEVGGRVAGSIGIIAGEGMSRHTGQFGYWLGEGYWGRGIATAVARAMVAYADENLPFVRLEAPVFAWNPVSMRVLEKAGFVREGVLRRSAFKDGEFVDTVMYARVR